MLNTGLGVKPARHHRRDPVGGHPLHHFVAGGDAGDEIASGSAFAFRGDERARDDRGAGMREHPEGVPLAAGKHHFRVGEAGAALGHLRPRHQHGRAVLHARFFVNHELGCLLPRRHLRAEQRGGEVLKRQALGAIDDGGR